MNTILMLKWAHIISSVVLAGTGFGSAFYLYFTNRTHNPQAIAEVIRLVVRADYWFTTPTIFIQPLTGFAMVSIMGYSYNEPWLLGAMGLYILAGACWLPVVWLQIQMSKMASAAVEADSPLPERYWQFARYWEWLGYPAFVSILVIFGLMVFKPG
jgi:uncharacterized membrane protein